MGAWGKGSFDNDPALDAVHEIVETQGYGLVESWFMDCAPQFRDGESIEVDLGARVIVGAEIVAALLEQPAIDLPEELSSWLADFKPKDLTQLSKKAAGAMYFVVEGESSEIRQLWEESDPTDWYSAIKDLKQRMNFGAYLELLAEDGRKQQGHDD